MATSAPRELEVLPGIPARAIPRHVAIIMDGNGRWAKQRGKPRIFGHREGAKTVRTVISESSRLGVGYLTLYSFSVENWKRPADEVSGLMGLYARYLRSERKELHSNDVRIKLIGRREGLPDSVTRELDESIRVTQNNKGLTLCIALNYGGRDEIVTAVRTLATRVQRGEITPEQIDERAIDHSLYTAGIPDPDLLIRTGGECRISNFLLWQISYAELFTSQALWPDFSVEDYHDALRSYAARERRFGDIAARVQNSG
ncbi:MAG: isoprenyl transferase [Phycisphaerae bacterium]